MSPASVTAWAAERGLLNQWGQPRLDALFALGVYWPDVRDSKGIRNVVFAEEWAAAYRRGDVVLEDDPRRPGFRRKRRLDVPAGWAGESLGIPGAPAWLRSSPGAL